MRLRSRLVHSGAVVASLFELQALLQEIERRRDRTSYLPKPPGEVAFVRPVVKHSPTRFELLCSVCGDKAASFEVGAVHSGDKA